MRFVLVSYFLVAWACFAFADSTNTQVSAHRFVWSDSAIANRGPFATRPGQEWFQYNQMPFPDTLDGKPYWRGGVFVLPGTSDSLLIANGFVNIRRGASSFLHDYYEAKWPVELRLDELPLSIRQVKYRAGSMPYPIDLDWNKREFKLVDRTGCLVFLATIPGLPEEFMTFYGIVPMSELKDGGWYTSYLEVFWPKDLTMQSAPPEFYHVGVLELLEGNKPTRPRGLRKMP